MLKIEVDLVETFLAHKVFAFGAKVTAVDDGIDELIWV